MNSIKMPTRTLDPEQAELLKSLKAGNRIQIVQTIRVGSRKWEAKIVGVFRDINYLATGLSTERIPADDIIVPVVHFTKDNGELSSITIDENSSIKRI